MIKLQPQKKSDHMSSLWIIIGQPLGRSLRFDLEYMGLERSLIPSRSRFTFLKIGKARSERKLMGKIGVRGGVCKRGIDQLDADVVEQTSL